MGNVAQQIENILSEFGIDHMADFQIWMLLGIGVNNRHHFLDVIL